MRGKQVCAVSPIISAFVTFHRGNQTAASEDIITFFRVRVSRRLRAQLNSSTLNALESNRPTRNVLSWRDQCGHHTEQLQYFDGRTDGRIIPDLLGSSWTERNWGRISHYYEMYRARKWGNETIQLVLSAAEKIIAHVCSLKSAIDWKPIAKKKWKIFELKIQCHNTECYLCRLEYKSGSRWSHFPRKSCFFPADCNVRPPPFLRENAISILILRRHSL